MVASSSARRSGPRWSVGGAESSRARRAWKEEAAAQPQTRSGRSIVEYMYVCMYVCMYECHLKPLFDPQVEHEPKNRSNSESRIVIIELMYVCMYVCM